jgi:ATP-dependent DNA helicase RecG
MIYKFNTDNDTMDDLKLLERLTQLCTLSENEVVEFKEAKKQYDLSKLGQYFSALSNEANLLNQNEAWLIFGVKDADKSIVGTPFRSQFADLQRLKSEIAAQTTHNLTFREIYQLLLPEGRVLLFNIPPAPRGMPVAWKEHYYGRDGESLSALNIDELERIRSQSVTKDWSAGICEQACLNDLSSEALVRARTLYQTKNPTLSNDINQWDDITFLNKVKLAIRGKITRAAIILLGKSESEHFISPALAKISWILKDKDNLEKDFQHFTCPFILSVDEVYKKIRNLKYRYLNGSLFPEEVEQYDPYIIREALHNCIAHQDYTLSGRINLVEKEDGELFFTNVGSFIPENVEKVIEQDAPQELYRNPFLAQAMVTLNMIDTIGSGIKRMFTIQRHKGFPLPDYHFSDNRVAMKVTGKILDMEYAKLLAQLPTLSLSEVILLDKVQKQKSLSYEEIHFLRKRQLVKGKSTHLQLSSRGLDELVWQKMIVDYLKKVQKGQLSDFEKILFDKLPENLNPTQKKNKIKNMLQALKKAGRLRWDKSRFWRVSDTER